MTTESLNLPRNDMASQTTAEAAASQPQRKETIIVLRARWTAPNRLRKEHRRKFKELRSLEQGYDGKVARCEICGKLAEVSQMQIHHVDHVEGNNQLSNLQIVEGTCNNIENAQWRAKQGQPPSGASRLSLRERGYNAGAGTATWGEDGRAGEKGEEMRYRFNNWRDNLETGPFRTIGGTIRLSLLAEKAVYGCSDDSTKPFGSSKTYTVYIKEDIAAGIFDAWKEGAVWMIRYLGPRQDSNSLK